MSNANDSKPIDVVICGAGIAGVSAAYFLSVIHGMKNIYLIDQRAPLSLTSDKSTECYRNWWPGPDNAMVALMNRSIDWLEKLAEESNNIFHLNRRGYLYLTAEKQKISQWITLGRLATSYGAGPFRIHENNNSGIPYEPSPAHGYDKSLTGADLILDTTLLQQIYPSINPNIVAALHVRRAGWLSAQQLGQYMLNQAREAGVKFIQDKVIDIHIKKNRVDSIELHQRGKLECGCFINAAGPFLTEIGSLASIEIPVYTELHQKIAIHDHLNVVPRNSPLLIWDDTQFLPWSDDEKEWLNQDKESQWVLQEMPGGAHTRPEGGDDSDIILLLWEYRDQPMKPILPPPLDPLYPEIAIRGMSTMMPRFSDYFSHIPRPMHDGGYYTKTKDNRPIIGNSPIQGLYIIGALSGYGIMASCAAGELVASHIIGTELPSYARAFSLERFFDANYLKRLENWVDTSQL